MELRNYQDRALNEVWSYLRRKSGNPCVVIPTGGGKTPVIAMMCKQAVEIWSGRVLIVAHVKELLEQSADKLSVICPGVSFGVYSAGLKRRDTEQAVIVAGVQSVYDKAEQLGRFDLVIVDEAHLIPQSGDGMYRQLIRGLEDINPDLRVIGMTATPFRTGSGMICEPDGILNEICYEISVHELIVRGFLSKLTSKAAVHEVDSKAVKIIRGEYDDAEAEKAFIAADVVKTAVEEILLKAHDRKAVLIFCQTINHAEQVADLLRWRCESVKEIYGDTKADERKQYVDDFRNGKVKYLVNVNVLTTGFDAPNVDCVCLLRMTTSPGLYYQMLGRGFRLAPGKENCLALDFGGNIERHGPVDFIKPKIGKEQEGNKGRKCPSCFSVVPVAAAVCPDCGHVFEKQEREINHNGKASKSDPLGNEIAEREVTSVTYNVHRKKGADESHPRTMRVSYQLANPVTWVSEWVCVEHHGFARDKAELWWARRSIVECPTNADAAVEFAEDGGLLRPTAIKIKWTKGSHFPEIVDYTMPTNEEVEQQEVKPMTDEEAVAWMSEIPW